MLTERFTVSLKLTTMHVTDKRQANNWRTHWQTSVQTKERYNAALHNCWADLSPYSTMSSLLRWLLTPPWKCMIHMQSCVFTRYVRPCSGKLSRIVRVCTDCPVQTSIEQRNFHTAFVIGIRYLYNEGREFSLPVDPLSFKQCSNSWHRPCHL